MSDQHESNKAAPFTLPVTRRTFGAGVAASAAVIASGLPFGAARAAVPLKLGVLLPRSGYLAKIGQANQMGVDVGIRILQDLGGYPDIEVVAGDTESNVQVARSTAEKMIGEGVNMLLGCFDSGQTTAVAQVAEQKGIPFVINIAAAPKITEQGYKFVFRNFPTGPRIVIDAFKLQKELFETTGATPKTVVMLHVNDTFGQAIKGGVNALLPKMGMPYKIVDEIAYDPRARDLSVEVAKAKATGADAVWAVSRLNDAILLTREMVKQRWDHMGIMSTGPGYYEDQYLRTLKKYGNFAISFVPWYDPIKPMTQRLISETKKMFPKQAVDTNIVYSFEAVLIAADAYKRAGSTDPNALAAALRETNIKDNVSIGPGIAFDAKGQNAGLGDGGVQNRDGVPRVILPGYASEIKPVFPMPGWRQR